MFGFWILGSAILAAVPVFGQSGLETSTDRSVKIPRPAFETISRRDLPAPLATARDIRFDGADHVLIAAGANGVFRLPIAAGTAAEHLHAGGYGREKIWIASRLATGPRHLVIGAPVYELVWRSRAGGPLRRDAVLEHVFDVDLAAVELAGGGEEERLLLLGTRRTETARSPEGAVAWTARLGAEGLADLRPLAFSIHGPGPQAMDACGSFDLGHVRFLEDGAALVVPGAEPGAYLYDRGGQLIGTWDTSALGLEVPCASLDQEKIELLAADPDARWTWLEQFETVDDVLELPSGPVLLTRRAGPEGTRWRAIQLLARGQSQHLELPFATPSRRSHLKADVRGDRIAFLLIEVERPERPPASTPGLVLTSAGLFRPHHPPSP